MNISLNSLVSKQKSFDFDFSQRYGEYNLQLPSLELRDYIEQINEEVGCETAAPRDFSSKKHFLHPFTLPQEVVIPHPLTQGNACPEPPSLDSDESLHSSGHTAFKSQCMLWKMLLPSVDTLCLQGLSVHHSCTHCKGYKHETCTILQICVSY